MVRSFALFPILALLLSPGYSSGGGGISLATGALSGSDERGDDGPLSFSSLRGLQNDGNGTDLNSTDSNSTDSNGTDPNENFGNGCGSGKSNEMCALLADTCVWCPYKDKCVRKQMCQNIGGGDSPGGEDFFLPVQCPQIKIEASCRSAGNACSWDGKKCKLPNSGNTDQGGKINCNRIQDNSTCIPPCVWNATAREGKGKCSRDGNFTSDDDEFAGNSTEDTSVVDAILEELECEAIKGRQQCLNSANECEFNQGSCTAKGEGAGAATPDAGGTTKGGVRGPKNGGAPNNRGGRGNAK